MQDDTYSLARQTAQQTMNAAAMIEAMGMQAENQQRLANGESIAYDLAAFVKLQERYGLTSDPYSYFIHI